MTLNVDEIAEIVFRILSSKDGDQREALGTAGVCSHASDVDGFDIPVGVSNRHIHLCQKDLDRCFGQGYALEVLKDLSQPGQFACKETVTICGPKGSIERVRILGPVRSRTQVELFAADNFKLGIQAPLKLSGDLSGAAAISVVGPCGCVYVDEAAIVAKRHIHMSCDDARRYGVSDGQIVSIEAGGPRGALLNNVIIRANDASRLDCHLDMEEANAVGLTSKSKVRLVY